MSDTLYDVVALGNAIVDMLAPADDAFLTDRGIHKNAMNLIDEARAHMLTDAANAPIVTSGGSAANSMVGIASFGGKAGFIGKVANDALGQQFDDEINNVGVNFSGTPLTDGPATARCIIFVTEDGARSMNTFLGASVEFAVEDVDVNLIKQGKIVYLEGYLFDKDAAKSAFIHAAEAAKAAGRKVALTLSDRFCVDRHRESFRHLVRGHVDLVFANEEELLSLYETDDFDEAVRLLSADTYVAAVTRSEKGSVVIGGDSPIAVPAEPIDKVVDTTGAGDQYAAGFMFGWARELPLGTCARLGHIAAAEVISHFGPRPQKSYQELAKAAGIFV